MELFSSIPRSKQYEAILLSIRWNFADRFANAEFIESSSLYYKGLLIKNHNKELEFYKESRYILTLINESKSLALASQYPTLVWKGLHYTSAMA